MDEYGESGTIYCLLSYVLCCVFYVILYNVMLYHVMLCYILGTHCTLDPKCLDSADCMCAGNYQELQGNQAHGDRVVACCHNAGKSHQYYNSLYLRNYLRMWKSQPMNHYEQSTPKNNMLYIQFVRCLRRKTDFNMNLSVLVY